VNRAEWLKNLRTAFLDADAAAEDMLRPPSARGLGPAQHRKLYRDAAKQVLFLLDHPPDEAPDAPSVEEEALPADMPPAGRARRALIYYFSKAMPGRIDGRQATYVARIADDIIEAAVAAARDVRDAPSAPSPAAG
jgi:hypothetical protein